METRAVDSFRIRMLDQLDFRKSEKYAKKFVSNLSVYETGQPGKKAEVAFRPTEIKDIQLQNIFFIGAGLWLVKEELKLKGRKSTRNQREQAVKELLSDLYSGTAPQLLENRPKVAEVKDACFDFRSSGLSQEASPQSGLSTLKNLLKDLEENPVSDCTSRAEANKCKNALRKTLDHLRQRGIPKDFENRLEKRIETEVKGLHFYMVFRNLWANFDKSKDLHESRRHFKDALDACENAYVRIEEIFGVEKATPPETEEHLEKNRRDKEPSHETRGTKTSSLPSVETQMREDEVGNQSQCLRTNAIQVKSTEREPEMPEKISPREYPRYLGEERSQARAELSALREKNTQLEKAAKRLEKDLQMLTDERNALSDTLREAEVKLSRAEKLQSKANEDKKTLQDAVERLQKQIDEMTGRYQVECNALKADLTSKASEQRYSRLERVLIVQ